MARFEGEDLVMELAEARKTLQMESASADDIWSVVRCVHPDFRWCECQEEGTTLKFNSLSKNPEAMAILRYTFRIKS